MSIRHEPGEPRPAPSAHARKDREVVRMDASVTIGAVLRAIRRGDANGTPFDLLRQALRTRAAEGDSAARVVADWIERDRSSGETAE